MFEPFEVVDSDAPLGNCVCIYHKWWEEEPIAAVHIAKSFFKEEPPQIVSPEEIANQKPDSPPSPRSISAFWRRHIKDLESKIEATSWSNSREDFPTSKREIASIMDDNDEEPPQIVSPEEIANQNKTSPSPRPISAFWTRCVKDLDSRIEATSSSNSREDSPTSKREIASIVDDDDDVREKLRVAIDRVAALEEIVNQQNEELAQYKSRNFFRNHDDLKIKRDGEDDNSKIANGTIDADDEGKC